MFDKQFFIQHQKKLIWLLNAPLIKIWFRWCLRITKDDCKINEKIVRILPNSYAVFLKKTNRKIYIREDFRTHNKFSKRIYYAFRPLWLILHVWDWIIGDRILNNKLSFGFTVGTFYPDPDPETTSVDGRAQRYVFGSEESWATIRGGAGTHSQESAVNFNNEIGGVGSNNNAFFTILRCFFLFDTSSIGSGQTISAATFSIAADGVAKVNQVTGAASISLVKGVPATNTAVVNGDYAIANWTMTKYAADKTIASYTDTDATYNDWTLTDFTNISLTGISKFGLVNVADADNVAPSTSAGVTEANVSCYSADTAGTTKDPKLVVTYNLPGGGNFMLMGIQ